MKVKILAFGIAKDILQGPEIELEVAANTKVGTLKQELLDRYPAFEKLQSLAIAVNEEYASDDLLIQSSDELVLIPPVSGG